MPDDRDLNRETGSNLDIFGALRHHHPNIQTFCRQMTLYGKSEIIQLILIKTRLSRDFGSNAGRLNTSHVFWC